jgi:hypothetical protein
MSSQGDFFKVILAHEAGTYDDHNWYVGNGGNSDLRSYLKGSSKNRYPFLKKNLTEYTIGEIRAFMQNPRVKGGGQLWATGKYQIIPVTFNGICKTLKLADNVKYDEKTQDAMGVQLLLDRSPIKKYLEGKSSDVQKAALSIAQIWSSVGVPYPVKGSKKDVVKNESYYSGGGDTARTKTEDVQSALSKFQKNYSESNTNTNFNTGSPETPNGSSGESGTGSSGTSGTSGTAGTSGTSAVDPKTLTPTLTLKKKSGPGELMGVTEKGVYLGEAQFTGVQFDQPGTYVVSVIPSSPEFQETEFTITVTGDPQPKEQEPRGKEEESSEGSRPIIAQIDKPTITLKPIEYERPKDKGEKQDVEIAYGLGFTPFFWYMGYQIMDRDIRQLKLYHDKMVPMVSITFVDGMGLMKRDGFPLDNTKFEVFLNSGSKNLKSIHMKFKLTDFQENKDKSYTIVGSIDLQDFYKVNYKSHTGTSFETLREICKELGIGFNSNITNTNDTMKWTNTGKLYKDFMSNIITHSYISDASFVTGYIDFYYCFNYVDVEKEWVRDITKDIGIISQGLAGTLGSPPTGDEGKLSRIILSNDKSGQFTNLKFTNYKLNNESTRKSITKGQFTTTKFYDTASKSFLIFDIDSLTSDGEKTVILKGQPGDEKELKTNFRTIFGGRIDMENVHKNYLYAETQNKVNFDNLGRITVELDIPNPNFNLYKYQKVEIQFINDAKTVTNDEYLQKRISGEWIITEISYIWQSGSLTQKLMASRKELGKLPEEINSQTTDKKKENNSERNENKVGEQGIIPNSVYKVDQQLLVVDKLGVQFTVKITEVSENGLEIVGDVLELYYTPKPDPNYVPPAIANNGTSGTSGVAGTSGTSGVAGTSGTSGVAGTSGTSGVAGTSGTSGTTSGKFNFVIGDSIAAGLASLTISKTKRSGAYSDSSGKRIAPSKDEWGTSQVGANPEAILGFINEIGSAKLSGKKVLLSSGYTNGPAQKQKVKDQLALLKGWGCKVYLVGATNKPPQNLSGAYPGGLSDANTQLKSIADEYGFTFLGEFTPSNDGIHPVYKNYYNSNVSQYNK